MQQNYRMISIVENGLSNAANSLKTLHRYSLKDFDFYLPEDLIAQEPASQRDHSRLLLLDKRTGAIQHKKFYNIFDYINKDDLFVFNDTKVIPARLYGKKESGGAFELLLLHCIEGTQWQAMVKPGKKLKPGHKLIFGDGKLTAEIVDRTPDGSRIIKFHSVDFLNDLEKHGVIPLPPYITKPLESPRRYQTVYAKHSGSSAAPTAGLHFTPEILQQMKKLGMEQLYVTLHIGPGTFRPVKTENIEEHQMHSEFFQVSGDVIRSIWQAKKEGRRIIPVGTTSARTLESVFTFYNDNFEDTDETGSTFDGCIVKKGRQSGFEWIYDNKGCLKKVQGWTDIFIYPGYSFKIIDAIITNFHLPRSTLIMMVSAFAGRDYIMQAYEEAVREKYRFFSFGDSMFIR